MKTLNCGVVHRRFRPFRLLGDRGCHQTRVLTQEIGPRLRIEFVGNNSAQLPVLPHAFQVFALHDRGNGH